MTLIQDPHGHDATGSPALDYDDVGIRFHGNVSGEDSLRVMNDAIRYVRAHLNERDVAVAPATSGANGHIEELLTRATVTGMRLALGLIESRIRSGLREVVR